MKGRELLSYCCAVMDELQGLISQLHSLQVIDPFPFSSVTWHWFRLWNPPADAFGVCQLVSPRQNKWNSHIFNNTWGTQGKHLSKLYNIIVPSPYINAYVYESVFSPCMLIFFSWHFFNVFFQMTFAKLIKDLTLSFGEIQRKKASRNNFCMKNSQRMTKRRKH